MCIMSITQRELGGGFAAPLFWPVGGVSPLGVMTVRRRWVDSRPKSRTGSLSIVGIFCAQERVIPLSNEEVPICRASVMVGAAMAGLIPAASSSMANRGLPIPGI